MELTHSDRAQVLVEALPYIQRYYGKTIVIKYGGNAMISDELRKAVINDIILLRLVGIHAVLSTACATPIRRPWRLSRWSCAAR